jgi:inorganic triphosphatase YgiF
MQKETEIKLRVSRETLAALREHPLLKKRNKSGWERRELMNQYFDTPERDLAQAKVALRLRKDGDEVIQTLKTRGQSVAGLSERNEYDWKLPKAKLDVKKLDGECWPEALAELTRKPSSRSSPPISSASAPKSPGAVARPKWSSKPRWTSVMWWSASRRKKSAS